MPSQIYNSSKHTTIYPFDVFLKIYRPKYLHLPPLIPSLVSAPLSLHGAGRSQPPHARRFELQVRALWPTSHGDVPSELVLSTSSHPSHPSPCFLLPRAEPPSSSSGCCWSISTSHSSSPIDSLRPELPHRGGCCGARNERKVTGWPGVTASSDEVWWCHWTPPGRPGMCRRLEVRVARMKHGGAAGHTWGRDVVSGAGGRTLAPPPIAGRRCTA